MYDATLFMRRGLATCSCRGLTMIETLGVVALLAMATAYGAVSLSGATRQARLDEASHTLALADATARTLARQTSRVVLGVASDGRSVFVQTGRDGDRAWQRHLPEGCVWRMGSTNGEPRTTLTFEPAGRCSDYERAILLQGRVVAHERVSGITGWAQPVEGSRE